MEEHLTKLSAHEAEHFYMSTPSTSAHEDEHFYMCTPGTET